MARDFDGRTQEYSVTEDYDATSAQPGGYLQDTWTGAGGRVSLTAGLRFDHFARTGETRMLPRGAATWSLSKNTRVLAAFGAYAQFPGFEELLGRARRHERGGPPFDPDFDQRHTLTVFASYRVGPTLNLSTKYRPGRGFRGVGSPLHAPGSGIRRATPACSNPVQDPSLYCVRGGLRHRRGPGPRLDWRVGSDGSRRRAHGAIRLRMAGQGP